MVRNSASDPQESFKDVAKTRKRSFAGDPIGRSKRMPSIVDEDKPPEPADPRTPDERCRSMIWAQRLKRVFGINVTTCIHSGGAVRVGAAPSQTYTG